MTLPSAVQLYSLRAELARDPQAPIRRLAEIGYVGVEPFGLNRSNVSQAEALYRELDLAVPSVHVPLPLGKDRDDVLAVAETLRCTRVVSSGQRDDFSSPDGIKRTCERLNDAQAVAAQNGLQFIYHNHEWEFQMVDGRRAFDTLLECLGPEVAFEVDTYWAQTGGIDPAALIARLGERVPLLHLKDGPCVRGEPMVALGEGLVDLKAAVAAGEPHAEWAIVEMDLCATDMLAALEQSYRYLTSTGLAYGRH